MITKQAKWRGKIQSVASYLAGPDVTGATLSRKGLDGTATSRQNGANMTRHVVSLLVTASWLGGNSVAWAQEVIPAPTTAQGSAASEPGVSTASPDNVTGATSAPQTDGVAQPAISAPGEAAVPAVSAITHPEAGPAATAVKIRLTQKKPWKRHDNSVQGTALRLIGLRASMAYGGRDGGSQDNLKSGGGNLMERGIALLNRGALNARYLDFLQIGGDSHGLSYRADGQLSLGARWLWTRTMGGVVRVGARGQVAKEGGLFHSDVRAPLVDLGVHHHSSLFQLDAVVEGAPVLTGFFQPPDSNTRLHGSRALGGLLSLAVSRFRLDAEVSTVWHERDLLLAEGRAWGCVATKLGLGCLDFRRLYQPKAHRESAFQGNFFGLSWLLGQNEWLHAD